MEIQVTLDDTGTRGFVAKKAFGVSDRDSADTAKILAGEVFKDLIEWIEKHVEEEKAT